MCFGKISESSQLSEARLNRFDRDCQLFFKKNADLIYNTLERNHPDSFAKSALFKM